MLRCLTAGLAWAAAKCPLPLPLAVGSLACTEGPVPTQSNISKDKFDTNNTTQHKYGKQHNIALMHIHDKAVWMSGMLQFCVLPTRILPAC